MTTAGVWLITGIQAAGKSTVAQRLAGQFERAIHIRGGQFYRWAVNGWVHPTHPATEESRRHLRLRYRLSALVADEYHAGGFTVMVQDNIYGDDVSDWLRQVRAEPKHLVVLRPSVSTVAARERSRHSTTGKTAYRPEKDGFTPAMLDRALAQTPPIGLWLDTSAQTPDQTISEILDRQSEARVAETG